MSLAICSLIWDAKASKQRSQKVSYDDDGYHLVRFPYEGESYDPWHMHDPDKGGSEPSKFPDTRSGLIWPSHDGWGVLSATVHWEADSTPSEYRARFVRDPLGDGYDSTGTSAANRTGGAEFHTYVWQFFVHPDVPVGLKITARGSGDRKVATPISHAQFKLAIHTDVAVP
ncbi:hypothetical protein [Streptomyces sp. NPDC005438]|uniref:hypothetical protein n=1 Tax=Streptomyces sp. NPDC005438 TaxID=3156880 RepID=UPI0033AA0460